jgi:hypothetical protein
MRLVKVSAPRGKAADIARLAFDQGIADVTVQQVEQQKAGGEPEPRDTVDAKVSTAQGKAFIDAVLSAPFYDRKTYAIEVREPRSILKAMPTFEITRPVPAPIVDIDEELWQFTHITYSFVLRVFIASLLLSYGMTQNNLLFMIGGLLFLPFTPLVLACGFGALTTQWQLVGHALIALITAIALIFAGGLAVAAFAEGPIQFDQFPPMIAGLAFSFAIGLASSLATADDVGRRELIGLAAASQLALIPAWLGLSLVYGFDGTEADKLRSFAVNIGALVAGALAVYGFMFVSGELSHAAARTKEREALKR